MAASSASPVGMSTEERDGVGRLWRWIEEPTPVDPVENMARDAELLVEMINLSDDHPSPKRGTSGLGRGAGGEGLPAIRIYRWSTSAVTFGRLQNEDEVRAHFPGLTVVRRPTGGRAVVHGDDLTISVATRDEYLPRGTGGAIMSSYQVIVTGIVEALRRHGINSMSGHSRKENVAQRHGCENANNQRFKANDFSCGANGARDVGRVDCFASVASCDIADTVSGNKLVGSAQRREQGAILQQMSIHGDVIRRIGSLQTFVGDLRDCMKAALEIDDWLSVDH